MTQVGRKALEEVRAALRERQPNLHLHVSSSGCATIRGTFAVRGPDGRELDRYQVSIELPDDYPDSLPVVRETGGRIPWCEDRHVERNGCACLFLPDDRWNCFPRGAPFSTYLSGPVHNFLLSQTVYAETGKWPFGECAHGNQGVLHYYRGLLGTEDDLSVRRFLHVLAKLDLNRGQNCPCGSQRKMKTCCVRKITDLRSKISRETAARSLARLGPG